MDPVSAAGIGVVAFEILGCVGKILNFLLIISTKFKHANIKLQLLIGFLSSLRISIKEITTIADGLAGREDYEDVVEGLRTTLECTNLAVSVLDSKLNGLQSDSSDVKSKIEKLTVVLKGDEFGEWSSDIGHLVDALNLSLNAFQSRTSLERQGILTSPEAVEIMHVMKKRTSSMIWIETRKSAASQLSSASETSLNLDVAFSFDHQLMGSEIYQTAQRSHLRKALAAGRSEGININTKRRSTQDSYYDRISVSEDIGTMGVQPLSSSSQSNPVFMSKLRQHLYEQDLWTAHISDTDSQTTDQSESASSSGLDHAITEHKTASLDTTPIDNVPFRSMAMKPHPAIQVLPPSPPTTFEPSAVPVKSTLAATVSHSSPEPQTPPPGVQIFQSFRVLMDDPCRKVLPAALKKYNIDEDWRTYSLYIVYQNSERCLGLEEKPLIIFRQLDREGRKPMFILRRHLPPSSPPWMTGSGFF